MDALEIAPDLDDAALTAFGIGFADEGCHPYDPAERWWNESWFWDWYDADGTNAGHCRIGWIPNQDRVWLWLYVLRRHPVHGDEWLAVEHPYLDAGLLRLPTLAFDQVGTSVAYDVLDPLRRGRLRVSCRARVVSGARVGRMVQVSLDLEIAAAGAAHSTGQGAEEGHASDTFDARRYEQPIVVTCTVDVEGERTTFAGRGERDHSWGPRLWEMEWSFLVLNGAERRLMCVEVRFPGMGTIEVGYLTHDGVGTVDLREVALAVERNADLAVGYRGTLTVTAADGATFACTYETIASHEMDLSHVLDPSVAATTYRRNLIRAVPSDGGAPLLGWLEDHVLAPAGAPSAVT